MLCLLLLSINCQVTGLELTKQTTHQGDRIDQPDGTGNHVHGISTRYIEKGHWGKGGGTWKGADGMMDRAQIGSGRLQGEAELGAQAHMQASTPHASNGPRCFFDAFWFRSGMSTSDLDSTYSSLLTCMSA